MIRQVFIYQCGKDGCQITHTKRWEICLGAYPVKVVSAPAGWTEVDRVIYCPLHIVTVGDVKID